MPRILLVSGTAPGSDGVGAIILRDLVGLCEPDKFCALVFDAGTTLGDPSSAYTGFPIKRVERIDWSLSGSRLSRLVKWPFHWWRNSKRVQQLVREAVNLGRLHEVELLWAVLDSPTSLAVARKSALQLGIPFIVMVWDDIHHNLEYFGVYRLSQRSLLREWGRTLKEARNCAVIGESMKEEYDRAYGTDAIILRHGIGPDLIQPLDPMPSMQGPLRIGFIGSVTAGTAFQAFVRALGTVGWRVNGREVRLVLAGHRFDLRSFNPANIEYRGWRSLEESIAMLGECDVNYLPQPFEPGQQRLARLSFPTKLTSYLAAGRPILLHCPKYASLFGYLEKHPFGVWVGSLDDEAIVSGLTALLTDQSKYLSFVSAGRRAMEMDFSDERFRASFAQFLTCHGSSLSQVDHQGKPVNPNHAGIC